MTKRKAAIVAIVADVAENGKATHIGIRAYVENRISAKAFKEAREQGLRVYKARGGGNDGNVETS